LDYITNQQTHINTVCFISHYYSPTCIGRSCYYHQGVIQEYKQYATVARNACLKS